MIVVIGQILAALALFIGAAFVLVGAIGMLKFRDPMIRLHAPTKVGTMGVGSLLAASMIQSFVTGEGSMHELLIMSFLFVTAPISANYIAKVNIHQRSCDMPPPPQTDETWATMMDPDNEPTLAGQLTQTPSTTS